MHVEMTAHNFSHHLSIQLHLALGSGLWRTCSCLMRPSVIGGRADSAGTAASLDTDSYIVMPLSEQVNFVSRAERDIDVETQTLFHADLGSRSRASIALLPA